ncbi:ribonuclease Z [Endozoicomonas sp. OPT23]|uniref:ribonuclease Z n=1 Tax=Endozoicomonas sp. OPT23 TaxID=2072845 RepID=UPI00129C0907|nr:ribonuclease Z [Endozoicomonas sp. OPT23]MRI32570.1 ribonuclease Z [Endozoicomonas sp. OPT23]
MRLTFLGTSAGTPTPERNVTALALALDDSKSWYLVDCGEGTQHRLLKSRYTLSDLKAVFITHVHGDHMFGLPGLISTASMQGRKEPLLIAAPEGVESFVRHSLKCAAITQLPFELSFVSSDVSSDASSDSPGFYYKDDAFEVTAHELSHRVPSYAYRFEEAPRTGRLNQQKLETLGVPKGPLWGELQAGNTVVLDDGREVSPENARLPDEKGRVAIIGGDNDKPELLLEAMKGADVLVHEATFTDPVFQKVGPQYMHSTAKMVGEAAEQAGIASVILTHFSGRFRRDSKKPEFTLAALRAEAGAAYKGQVELAEDFSCWELNSKRELHRL